MPKVVINYEKCSPEQLDEVLNTCPAAVFEKQDDKVVVAQEDQCTVCRICEETCPDGGIIVTED